MQFSGVGYAVVLLAACLARPAVAQGAGCEGFLTEAFFRSTPPARVLTCVMEGARVEARDDDGNTVLHLAAAYAPDAAVTRVLLQVGADVTLRNAANRTPMHMAAAHSMDPAQIVTLAVWGAEVDKGTADDDCWLVECTTSPLHLAARRPEAVEVVTALLAAGADPNIHAGKDLADISGELTEDRYLPPLHLATRHAGVETVATLLQGGAKVDATDNGRRKRTALHYAAARKDGGRKIVQALLDAGASADAADFEENTPLMLAASRSSDPNVFARLLDAADEPCSKNATGITALMYHNENTALEQGDVYWGLHDRCRK